MKKIFIFSIVSFLLIGIITAGITFNFILADAEFTPTIDTTPTRQQGEITFLCDGKTMSVYLNEPNNEIDDDFEQAVNKICDKEITNVIDWNGRKYLEAGDVRSFEIEVIKEKECSNDGKVYDGLKCDVISVDDINPVEEITQ